MSFDFAEADRRRPDPSPRTLFRTRIRRLATREVPPPIAPRSATRQVTRIAAETARLPFSLYAWKIPISGTAPC